LGLWWRLVSPLRIPVQGVRADVLVVRPDDGSACNHYLTEVVGVAQFLEHPEVKQGRAIKDPHFTVGETECQAKTALRNNRCHPWIHGLPQWLNLVRLLATRREFPVRDEFIAM
jgi:hypothetical protein